MSLIQKPHHLLPTDQAIVDSISAEFIGKVEEIFDLLLAIEQRHLADFGDFLGGQQRSGRLPADEECFAIGWWCSTGHTETNYDTESSSWVVFYHATPAHGRAKANEFPIANKLGPGPARIVGEPEAIHWQNDVVGMNHDIPF